LLTEKRSRIIPGEDSPSINQRALKRNFPGGIWKVAESSSGRLEPSVAVEHRLNEHYDFNLVFADSSILTLDRVEGDYHVVLDFTSTIEAAARMDG